MPGFVELVERRGAVAVPLLILVAALAIHAPRLDRPFGPGLASAAASYQILFARHWDEAGFLALNGVPCVGPSGGTLSERHPYLHHPVLSYWMAYGVRLLAGWDEWVFRLLPFLGTVTSALLLGAITRRLLGSLAALLAGWIFLLTPMVFVFGDMPNPETLVLASLLGGWLLHERVRERPTRGRKLLFFAVAGIGMLIDWQAHFLVLALLAGEWLRPQHERRWREAVLLLPLSALAVLLLGAWGAAALGSVEALMEHVGAAARTPLVDGAASIGTFLFAQGRALLATMGWPLVLAGVVVLAAALTGRAGAPRLRAAALLLVPALVSVLLFRGPAFDHPFWWMPATGFFAFSGAWLLGRLLDARPFAGVLVTAALCGSLALISFAQQRVVDPPGEHFRNIGLLVNRFSAPGDIIITPESFGPALFYTERRIYENLSTVPAIESINAEATPRPVHVAMLLASAPAHRALIAWLDAHGARTPHPGVLHWTLRR